MVNDHETTLMDEVIVALRNVYGDDIFITDSENNTNIPKFPCCCFYKNNDYVANNYRTVSTLEVAVTETYTATIYADTSDECKAIANIIDEEIMQGRYYQRIYNQPLFNIDTTLSRRTVRWRGTCIKGGTN